MAIEPLERIRRRAPEPASPCLKALIMQRLKDCRATRWEAAVQRFLPRTGLVAEIRRKPALAFLERDAFSGRVVLNLVEAEPSDREITGACVREIDPAHGGRGRHGERLRQLEPRVLGSEEV